MGGMKEGRDEDMAGWKTKMEDMRGKADWSGLTKDQQMQKM